MAMTTGGPAGLSAEMNVTPLIDVLLVLLIIFMVITPMTRGERAIIPQPSPQDAPSPPDDNHAVVVQVRQGEAGLEVKVNQESVSLQALKPRLVDIFKKRAEKVLFVEADHGLDWESVAQVIDIAHSSGAVSIGLMTEQIPETS